MGDTVRAGVPAGRDGLHRRLKSGDAQSTELAPVESGGMMVHNLMDRPARKMVAETVELMAHLRKVRKLTGTQKRIVGDIEKCCSELLV